MRKSAVFWITCSGGVWFVVGVCLLILGVKFVVFSCLEDPSCSFLLTKLRTLTKSKEQSALLLVSSALFIGFIKGRFVLAKTARRVVKKIYSLKEPIALSQIYSLGYILLIAFMVFLGVAMRWLNLSLDIRGAIDIAIGSALMNGAMHYFRAAFKSNSRSEFL